MFLKPTKQCGTQSAGWRNMIAPPQGDVKRCRRDVSGERGRKPFVKALARDCLWSGLEKPTKEPRGSKEGQAWITPHETAITTTEHKPGGRLEVKAKKE